jgi:hypothetical protein
MKKLYPNQIRQYVYEPYDRELDGTLSKLTKIETLEEGFTLCEDESGYKFIVKNYGQKNKQVFPVCDILKDEDLY